MRLIDAEDIPYTMLYKENWMKGTGEEAQGAWKSDIDKLPTIDAVPVIRCKDCKHSHPWYADRRTCELWTETGVDVFNDGFCSYGERKDDADN